MKIFPYADSANSNSLEYQYSVLSPVVDIRFLEKNLTLKNIIILTLAYDFPYKNPFLLNFNNTSKTSNMPLDPLLDVCLAKLDTVTNYWNCLNTNNSTEKEVNFYFYGGIKEEGIYAVVLNTRIDNSILPVVENFLAKYIMIILISSLIVGVVFGVGIYVFIRIYRYREKYKKTKEQEKIAESKNTELQNMQTSFHQQTIGDQIDQIVYTTNPAFKIIRNEKKSQRIEELQIMQEQLLKRYKTFEKNNQNLKNVYENVNKQYEELQNYKEQLTKKFDQNILKQEDDS